MADSMHEIGICVTCNDFEVCIRNKIWTGPVLFCEEFDNYIPPNKILLNSKPKTGTSPFKGVCTNCENRENCKINDPTVGVWHCEEYR